MLTVKYLSETTNGFRYRHILAGTAGKYLGNKHWLGQEPLYLAGAGDDKFILLTQLFYTQNGDYILQVLIALKHLLHLTGNLIKICTDYVRVKHA